VREGNLLDDVDCHSLIIKSPCSETTGILKITALKRILTFNVE
jgi:hypothetical protein